MTCNPNVGRRRAGGVGLRALAIAGALAVSPLAASPAQASLPPFGEQQVRITARETPISAFLQNLFSQAGMTVVASPGLTGNVNGEFQGTARKVYGDIAQAFNLLTYYDGVAVYVYPATEISTRVVQTTPAVAPQVQNSVKSLGLPDRQNQIRIANRTLIATGSKRFLDQVDEVANRQVSVGSASAPATAAAPAPLEYRIYYLRYGWAEDVTMTVGGRQVTLPGVASILRSLMSNGPGGGASAQRIDRPVPPAVPSMRAGVDGPTTRQITRDTLGTLGLSQAANGVVPNPFASEDWNRLAQQPAYSQAGYGQPGSPPPTVIVQAAPEPRVVADNRLNAVIVRDTREKLNGVDKLVKALDVEPQLVEIEATIIDIDTDKVRQNSFGFKVGDPVGANQFGIGVGGGDAFNSSLTGSGTGLITGSVIGPGLHFQFGLQALVSKGAAQVVARPQVMTLSDVEAVFDNSKTFYVRVPGVEQSDLFNITAGTIFRVTPHVTRDQGQTRIRLLVSIQDGSLSGQKIDKIPIVQNSALNTQALLVEGQSLLLGGMVGQADANATDKMPILGDIPGFGFFFRSSRKESAHTERLFLISPRLKMLGSNSAAPRNSLQAPGANAPAPISPAMPQAEPSTVPPPPTPPPSTPQARSAGAAQTPG